MSYIDHNLLANEKILFRARMNWIVFLIPVVWTLLTIFLVLQNSLLQMLAFVTAFLAIITWFSSTISYATSEYVLTNKRVVIKVGLIRRVSLELFLQKIEGIQVVQGILGRIFGYGTIVIIGTGGTRDPFPLINDPLSFRKKVQQQIENISKET